ncbi:hypothetical protein NC653_037568 [Populus alba x Populus x berolinensis]|uniref:Uncharacterized protein n=1 Tax=Populus alba x Populus x berolinensis TaxID=444605 RepID=A0AAD6LEX4_9ROSI|nr:hypothetical protein NC653_037568 [Populus alba x Populus x berolinensis]
MSACKHTRQKRALHLSFSPGYSRNVLYNFYYKAISQYKNSLKILFQFSITQCKFHS